MLQAITDDLVHVGEPRIAVLLHNLFGGRTTVECPNDQIERHPPAAGAVHAMSASGQWDFVNDNGHIQITAYRNIDASSARGSPTDRDWKHRSAGNVSGQPKYFPGWNIADGLAMAFPVRRICLRIREI